MDTMIECFKQKLYKIQEVMKSEVLMTAFTTVWERTMISVPHLMARVAHVVLIVKNVLRQNSVPVIHQKVSQLCSTSLVQCKEEHVVWI